MASFARTSQPPTPTPPASAGTGAIAGYVNFPSEFLPSQLVYAISTKGAASGAYFVETATWQSAYTMVGVKPGTYFVYTAVRSSPDLNCFIPSGGAGYSRAVLCGLSVDCKDHTPVPVTVKAGQVTSGIDPVDWYAPQYFFAAPPERVVPLPLWRQAKGGAFSTPLLAIQDLAPADARAFLAGATRTSCPINRACVSLSEAVMGTHAAYVVGSVGSNANLHTCEFLAYQDARGWHAYEYPRCPLSTAFPVIGALGQVFAGMCAQPSACVNVRSTPGTAGKVLACVRQGTTIEIDEGPYWVAPPDPTVEVDGFWWHLKGRGWLLNSNLRPSA